MDQDHQIQSEDHHKLEPEAAVVESIGEVDQAEVEALEAVEPVQTDTQVQNHLLVQAEPEEMAKAVAEVPEELQDLEDLVLL